MSIDYYINATETFQSLGSCPVHMYMHAVHQMAKNT